MPVPRVGVRPRRAAHRDAQRRRGRGVRAVRLPAPRDRAWTRTAGSCSSTSATSRGRCSTSCARGPSRSPTSSATSSTTLRIGRRIVYEVAANWKIVVENYNECLHCPTVHPELVQIVPLYRFGEVWDEETHDDGNWMVDGATSFTRTGRSTLPPFPGLGRDDRRMYYGTFQFPNVLLNLHPDAAMVYTLYPRGAGHTTVVSDYLFAPGHHRRARLRPGSRGRAVGPHLEAGLGDLRASPDRCRVAGLPLRRLPAQGPVPVRLQRALSRGDGPAASRLSGRGAAARSSAPR